MSAPEPSEDFVAFADDVPPTAPIRKEARHWPILVVDDDEDVHHATAFALRDVEILGRPLALVHAYSATDAWAKVNGSEDEFAVALIDVVMETADAGLQLVHDLRAAGHTETRLVLRTGQPGYAPEMSVIAAYEIDDYRTKDELTRTRLITVLTAAIRTYENIHRMSHHRAGLETIVGGASRLFRRTDFPTFCRAVFDQAATLLGTPPHGLVCASMRESETGRIMAAAGRFAELQGGDADDLPKGTFAELWPALPRGLAIREGSVSIGCTSSGGARLLVYVAAPEAPADEDLGLLRLFAANLAIGFENLSLIARLDRLAYIDPVLEIPNLNAFEAALEIRRRKIGPAARMALISIDSYDAIVAVHGQSTAQALLRAVYRTFIEGGGGEVIAARVGDGTFALLGDSVHLDAELVNRAVSEPYRVEGIEIPVSATATLINLADVDADPAAMMRSASSALLHVERTHRGQVIPYTDAMRADVDRRFGLLTALRRSTKTRDGLKVVLQPKVALSTRTVVGAEALLRWTSMDETVSPSEFIPIAESGGLTPDLTDFVIDAVGAWAAKRREPLPVAINLSMADLNNPGFARRLLTRVADAGLAPATVEFEITEDFAMQDAPWAIDQLEILHGEGFRIALDDFGTGYSSLGYFDKLPIDILKIDRAFIAPLTVGGARNSLAAIAVNMANAFGVGCVAEGVETAEQCQILEFLGCPVAQGFHLGRPTPIEAFAETFLA
ncbi:putative diguanylate phosphodiesterase (EAL domain) [uncultured Alphaproteobacteria bacterium]|uniref:Putative diguanylate phosphodiesterase (EAL domain) n=1 Tax=uncultured Alphaproteobacteria bacterium TaxID=91750 RepID=A0A212KLK5_9PROT|nr:putative diguanylate phosphodiesterase (EAL domain) [uncultured Alphaproteobacteria bacterium]